MIINEIGIRGYKSFGNNEQVLNLNTERGELILLLGENGSGKSVVPSTEIQINIPIETFNLNELVIFLETMDGERNFLLYIKEKNHSLYEQYIHYRSEQNSIK